MKRLVFTLIAFAMVAAFATASSAQTPDRVMVSIVEIHVKPGMEAQYEAARKEGVANWARNNFSYAVNESRGDGSIYRRTTVVESLTDLDKASTQSGANPVDQSVRNRLNEAIDHTSNTIVWSRPDLAYTPENPRLSGDEVGFYHYVFLYPRRGTREQMTQAFMKHRELYVKHGDSDTYAVAQTTRGPEVPMLIVRFSAKDAADYFAQDPQRSSDFLEERGAIRSEILSLCRRFEVSNNTRVPDISYQPGGSN